MADQPDVDPSPSKSRAELREVRSFLHYAILFYGVGLMFALVIGVVLLERKTVSLSPALAIVYRFPFRLGERVRRSYKGGMESEAIQRAIEVQKGLYRFYLISWSVGIRR